MSTNVFKLSTMVGQNLEIWWCQLRTNVFKLSTMVSQNFEICWSVMATQMLWNCPWLDKIYKCKNLSAIFAQVKHKNYEEKFNKISTQNHAINTTFSISTQYEKYEDINTCGHPVYLTWQGAKQYKNIHHNRNNMSNNKYTHCSYHLS